MRCFGFFAFTAALSGWMRQNGTGAEDSRAGLFDVLGYVYFFQTESPVLSQYIPLGVVPLSGNTRPT